MLPDRLEDITEASLAGLVANGVAESRGLEYKLALPGNSDADKKEFLADISSIANTIGGDILFGIREDAGVAAEVVGVHSGDMDGEIARLESIIASGLQPRIEHHVHFVPLTSGGGVLLIRIRQSLLAPHRVVFGGHEKFYGRNANGKYSLDVEQLRSAFLQSASVNQRIRDFHQTRTLEIEAGHSPLPVSGTNKIIIHLIPRESFASNVSLTKVQLAELKANTNRMRPMYANGWFAPEYNLEGVISYSGVRTQASTARSYLQVFRNGVIEAVETSILDRDGVAIIPSQLLESEIIDHVRACLNILSDLEIATPVFVFITLTGVQGQRMAYGNQGARIIEEVAPIRTSVLSLPEVVFDSYDQPTDRTLLPAFEIVWNACGIATSPYFDVNGNWRH